jgi:hypothetical protein
MAELYVSINRWNLDDEGMMRQTLEDMQDPNVRLFTETAKAHNQVIADKETDGPD